MRVVLALLLHFKRTPRARDWVRTSSYKHSLKIGYDYSEPPSNTPFAVQEPNSTGTHWERAREKKRDKQQCQSLGRASTLLILSVTAHTCESMHVNMQRTFRIWVNRTRGTGERHVLYGHFQKAGLTWILRLMLPILLDRNNNGLN